MSPARTQTQTTVLQLEITGLTIRLSHFSHGWDASPLQGYPATALNSPVAIYTPGWRKALKIQCLSQEHSTMCPGWFHTCIQTAGSLDKHTDHKASVRQPHPQGLLLDDFQNGSWSIPLTHHFKKWRMPWGQGCSVRVIVVYCTEFIFSVLI